MTYVCGQADIIIDYAKARRREESISTAVTESTVMNGTLERDHTVAEQRAGVRFGVRHDPQVGDGLWLGFRSEGKRSSVTKLGISCLLDSRWR
jgi:hypothetical protein